MNETDNPDGICDDCKAAIILDRDVLQMRKIFFDG